MGWYSVLTSIVAGRHHTTMIVAHHADGNGVQVTILYVY